MSVELTVELDVYYPETLVHAEQLYDAFKLLECPSQSQLPSVIPKVAEQLDALQPGSAERFIQLHKATCGYLWAQQVFKYTSHHHNFDFFQSNGEEFGSQVGLFLLELGANKVTAKARCEYYVNDEGENITPSLVLSPEDLGKSHRDVVWAYS